MKRKINYIAIAVISIILVGCATSAITGRRHLKLVSSEQVNQQAALAYKDFLNAGDTRVVTATAQATLVKSVGNRLAAATNEFLKQRGVADQFNFNWEFNLIESDQANAWCMPGGKVAIYTGILPITANEAGLAVVMGHEIAHAVEEHSVAQVSNQMALQLGAQVLTGAAQVSNSRNLAIFSQVYGLGGGLGMLRFSRNDELAADRAGLIIMAMAGYDPKQAVNFWERMAAAKSSGQSPPEFLSTHPSDARRITQIQNLIPEAMQYYRPR